MMPAFTSSSLKCPMSNMSFSLGGIPCSEFFVALTITMTRIVRSLSPAFVLATSGGGPDRQGIGSFFRFLESRVIRPRLLRHERRHDDGVAPTVDRSGLRERARVVLARRDLFRV